MVAGEDDGRTCCQTARTPPAGIGGREAGNNQGRSADGLCAVDLLGPQPAYVVVCEVNCLGDLGVARRQGLASSYRSSNGHRGAVQPTPPTQNLCTLVTGELAPSLASFLGFLDQLLGLSLAGQLVKRRCGGLGTLKDCAAYSRLPASAGSCPGVLENMASR